MSLVRHRFSLDSSFVSSLRKEKPNFGFNGFGEFIFYRTYSRMINNRQESWADVVVRVVDGVFSIRKDFYLKNYIYWNEPFWQKYAKEFAKRLFDMCWLPPGRGLWAMGTNYIYERGSMALYNCAFVDLNNTDPYALPNSYSWLMDTLMNGVGVGFSAYPEAMNVVGRNKKPTYTYTIPDSREGWCESVRLLLMSFFVSSAQRPKFDYSKIRARGLPIKSFGGIASGPEPLKELHEQIINRCMTDIKSVQLKMDLANLIGCCVVAGNIRRSAEIALGYCNESFMDLKDYSKYPEREAWGWTSNNSVVLEHPEDFENLHNIAKRIKNNGEPGYVNVKNFKYGRLGKHKDNAPIDHATGINPCGEIPLESFEVCNLAEVCPTRCNSEQQFYEACRDATFYTSTITLLPTHSIETNAKVAKNRRIGVSLVDVSGWKYNVGLAKVTSLMRHGYTAIKEMNQALAEEAGTRVSIRLTTIKPGGTIPKLPGLTSGIGHPNFHKTLRRVRVADNSAIVDILKAANVPFEPDVVSKGTLVFEFPIIQGPAKPAHKVSLWEQAANIVHAQREWADNAVSNTLMFRQSEVDDIEPVLSFLAPLTKSISMLPIDTKTYPQMPEEELSDTEYEKRLASIKPINWSKLSGSDGMDTKFCDGDKCSIDQK